MSLSTGGATRANVPRVRERHGSDCLWTERFGRLSVIGSMCRPIGGHAAWRCRRLLIALAACYVALLMPELAHGDGFRILDQGAAAAAQGAAFAAQADDPSAIHYNPAGMTQLPRSSVLSGDESRVGCDDLHQYRPARARAAAPPAPSPIRRRARCTSRRPSSGVGVDALTTADPGDRSGLAIRAPRSIYPSSGPLANVTTSRRAAAARHQADRGLPTDTVSIGRRGARHLHVLQPDRRWTSRAEADRRSRVRATWHRAGLIAGGERSRHGSRVQPERARQPVSDRAARTTPQPGARVSQRPDTQTSTATSCVNDDA